MRPCAGFAPTAGPIYLPVAQLGLISSVCKLGRWTTPVSLKTNAHVWTVSAQHWDLLDPDISQFERTRPRK